MSELKVINAYQLTTNTEDSDVYIHNDDFGCGGDLVKCYLKSEADKTLAAKDAENLKLKRALWLARADRAIMTLDYFTLKCRWFKDYMKVEPPKCDVNMVHKWANIERKCRAKAEEYK